MNARLPTAPLPDGDAADLVRHDVDVPTGMAPAEPLNLITVSMQQIFAFEPTPGTRLTCRRGTVWVTQEGDPDDHVLVVGEQISFSRSQKVVVQSLSAQATVQIP